MTSSQSSPADPHADRFRLDGRSVFLSGAAGHLGRAMAAAFAGAGAHVILNGRTGATLEKLAAKLERAGGRCSIAVFDVTDAVAAQDFFGGLERLDVLVNNAVAGVGGSGPSDAAEAFRAAVESGLVASHRNIMAALPALENGVAAAGEASVINVTSIWARVSPDPAMYQGYGIEAPPAYGATKAGLMQLTRHLAVRLAPKRVRVNSLSPGIFPWDSVIRDMPDFVERASRKNPMGRLGLADEIGGPAVFLASKASSYMTGADLLIDGGWTAW
jgi:NAD(P)-dependent dehydrogenase (short-subunit alcohol dehydrogenase family)